MTVTTPSTWAMAALLVREGFAGECLLWRTRGARYADLVEALMPDVRIEDDCRSIGGAWQMCITRVCAAKKVRIRASIVRAFGGIDALPENVHAL
nr:hypothetical protein [Maliibacterium massiliense]